MANNSVKKNPRVALIGATGIAGRELIRILEERAFPLFSLELFASSNSAGEAIEFRSQTLIVNELVSADQVNADIAFFAAGAKVSKLFVEKIATKGCVCIDKSSAFRMHKDVPLIVPEVNGHLLKKNFDIIASPNCVAVPLAQVLWPLKRKFDLSQVILSTYQAVSGAGKQGTDELESQ